MVDQTLNVAMPISNAAKNLVGQKFGKLTVLYPVGVYNPGKRYIWRCRCECGNERNVLSNNLLQGGTRSCGCISGSYRTERGASKHPFYKTWQNMLSRCYNPHASGYKNYGGKGITVCTRWQESFTAFLEDIGPRPTPQHTLDRIDPYGNYTPENIRWADKQVQANNRRNTGEVNMATYTFNGETGNGRYWADKLGYPGPHTLLSRRRLGWTDEEILTTPVGQQRLGLRDCAEDPDPRYSLKEWHKAVVNGETRRGYTRWIRITKERNQHLDKLKGKPSV